MLRIGVVDAAGRIATNLPGDRWVPQFDAPPQRPVLTAGGLGWVNNLFEIQWWLWPFPKDDAFSVVCEWPAYGIEAAYARLSTEAWVWEGLRPDDQARIERWEPSAVRPRARRLFHPPTYEPELVADAVQRARHQAGVSTEELAQRLGVDEYQVRQIEAGAVAMDELELQRVGTALGTGISLYLPGMRPGRPPGDHPPR